LGGNALPLVVAISYCGASKGYTPWPNSPVKDVTENQ
jgi:hypothetical protein